MDEFNITKAIKESLIATIVAFTYINLTVGIFPLFILLLPVPFIVLGIRNNIFTSIGAMTLFTIVIGSVANTSLAMSFFILSIPFIITVQYLIEDKTEMYKTILIGGVVIFISLILILSLESKVSGVDLAKEVEETFNTMKETQVGMLEDLKLTDTETSKVIDGLEGMYDYTVVIMPSIFLVLALMASYLNYKLSTYIVNSMGYREIKFPRFSLIRLPDNIILGSFTIVVATIIINKLELNYHNALNANIVLLLSLAYMVQGLAIMSFILTKLRFPKLLRVIIIGMNIVFVPMVSIIMLLGFADSLFDFRKIRRRSIWKK